MGMHWACNLNGMAEMMWMKSGANHEMKWLIRLVDWLFVCRYSETLMAGEAPPHSSRLASAATEAAAVAAEVAAVLPLTANMSSSDGVAATAGFRKERLLVELPCTFMSHFKPAASNMGPRGSAMYPR